MANKYSLRVLFIFIIKLTPKHQYNKRYCSYSLPLNIKNYVLYLIPTLVKLFFNLPNI